MVNVGENRARKGVTDCPESRNEDKNRKTDKNALGRYAPSHTPDTGDAILIPSSSKQPPQTKNSHFNPSNLYVEASRSRGSHQGTFLQVRIIFLPAELRLNRNLSSEIINNINYLMTIKAMSLTLNVQKDSITRSSKKCDMKVPAAVGQNMSTAVKGAAYAYGGLNDLNHVMRADCVSPVEEVLYMYEPVNFGLAVEVSCIYTSLSTSGRQLRCLVLHKPVDFGSTVEAKFSAQYD
ncbi:hypothetical protein E3N88_39495 [Mikania micrantha]|uniref:Uncharacterized protein n=1 Tax=Mikania micrantha TaxID=192012 RepID=A0A5N6LWY4_9ASTR|nr:hypothetical protein E3N88_39495 [Mikania micrantha]